MVCQVNGVSAGIYLIYGILFARVLYEDHAYTGDKCLLGDFGEMIPTLETLRRAIEE